MERYLYLSIVPEALIASMLPPLEFGKYFAIGTKKRTRGQAIFFKVNRDFVSDYLKIEDIDRLCVPNPDGSPKRSKYIAIYRVLEHVPMSAIENLYLVTDDGRVLELEKSEFTEENHDQLHLYQQLGPVRPLIASSLDPAKFCKYITNTKHPVSVPKIMFVELILNGLSNDPKNASTENLPYQNIDHMKDCLIDLKKPDSKPNKTVVRNMRDDLLYRTTKNGFFIGDQSEMFYYKFPSKEELEGVHYPWWKSALTQGFNY
ncbi:MAG: hypothetical protein ABFS12_00495 [Bacteroidota bacterium]